MQTCCPSPHPYPFPSIQTLSFSFPLLYPLTPPSFSNTSSLVCLSLRLPSCFIAHKVTSGYKVVILRRGIMSGLSCRLFFTTTIPLGHFEIHIIVTCTLTGKLSSSKQSSHGEKLFLDLYATNLSHVLTH